MPAKYDPFSGRLYLLPTIKAGDIDSQAITEDKLNTEVTSKLLNFGNAFSLEEIGEFDTLKKSHYNALAIHAANGSTPCVYYYEGTYKRFYFTYYGSYKDAAGTNKSAGKYVNYVSYYDLQSEVLSRDVEIPHGFPTSTDQHNIPTLIVADDGRILLFQESLLPSGAHNSSIEVWRSNAAETIEDPSNPGMHYFTKVAEFGYPVTGTYKISYPKIIKGSASGELFMQARGYDAANGHSNLLFAKSIDNGQNWTNLSGTANLFTLVGDCNPTFDSCDWYFYSTSMPAPRTCGLNVLTYVNEGPTGTNTTSGQAAASRYKTMHYLYSIDGITWGNIEWKNSAGASGFSKNIVSSGAITRAELDANFLVYDANAVQNVSLTPFSTGVDSAGNPYILWQYFTRPVTKTGDAKNLLNVYFTYHNGTTWVNVDISSLILTKNNIPDSIPSIFYNRGDMVAYSSGHVDLMLYRYVGKENVNLKKYTAISADADRVIGGIYIINTTQTDHFGTGIIAGDIIQITSSTPSCDANNTLLAFDTEFVVYRTQNYGLSWQLYKRLLQKSDSLFGMNSNNAAISFNYLDSKKLALLVGIPASYNGTALTHMDFKLFFGQID